MSPHLIRNTVLTDCTLTLGVSRSRVAIQAK